MTAYRPAYEAERIGERLIAKHHQRLDGIRIDYVFRDKAAKKSGRTVWGTARKVSGLNAYLAAPDHDEVPDDVEDFFVIELAEDVWAMLEKHQREALVDHELSHCVVGVNEKGDVVLSTVMHDVEEFAGVIERHGLWRPDLEQFIATGVAAGHEQLDLGLSSSAVAAVKRFRDTMAEAGGGSITAGGRTVDIPAADR